MDLSGAEPSAAGSALSDSGPPTIRGGIKLASKGSGFDAIYGGVPPSSIARQDTDSFPELLGTTLEGEPEPTRGLEKQWIPLYGYQGIVWFQVGTFNTFVDAIIRLLTADEYFGVNYNLYLLDKNVDYAHDEAARKRFLEDTSGNNGITIIEEAGDQDVPRDVPAWEWVHERLSVMEHSGIDVHSKAFFVAGHADEMPWIWQPNPGAEVMKLMLEWELDDRSSVSTLQRPDVAYVRMPSNAIDVDYTNYFAPWLARACRVLTAGHLPNRPGEPPVPDAFIAAKFDKAVISSYGGLSFSPRIWRSMVQIFQANPQRPTVLLARRSSYFSDAISVFLPGGSLSPAVGLKLESLRLNSEVETWKKRKTRLLNHFRPWVMKVMEASMDLNSLRKLKRLEFELSGQRVFATRADGTASNVTIDNRKVTDDWEVTWILDGLTRILNLVPLTRRPNPSPPAKQPSDMAPHFISILPVFSKYTIRPAGSKSGFLSWDPAQTDMREFRALLARLFGSQVTDLERDPTTWFIIQQGQYWMDEANELHDIKPKFTISPFTSEKEWQIIRKYIVEPDIYVSLAAEEDVRPQFGPKKGDYEIDYWRQGFGYRETEETPEDSLYLPFTMPHLRKDWADRPTRKDWRLLSDMDLEYSRTHLQKNTPLRHPSALKNKKERKNKSKNRDNTGDAPDGDVVVASDGDAQEPAFSIPSVGKPRTMSAIERAMQLREYSYAWPLDVQMDKVFPINAPPIDQVLNPGRDSLPAVSLAVLTPSESRRLQHDYFELRTLILGRTQRCPYAGCKSVFPVNKTVDMQKHLLEAHAAEKCNFCDELLFRYWTPQQRRQHIASEHGEFLKDIDKFGAASALQLQPKGRTVFSREKHWNFCSRCGRNHRILISGPDRLQHDSICYPGIPEADRWEACTVCGGHKPADAPASYKHKHREGFEEFQPYCALCALPLGLSTRDDADTHTQNCCGNGTDPGRFCPWCARKLKPGIEQRKDHIEACEKRPAPSELHGPLEGPINVLTNEYYPAVDGTPPPSGDEGSRDSEAEFEPQVDEAAGKKEETFKPAKRKPARKKGPAKGPDEQSAPARRASTRATRSSPPVAAAKSAIFRPCAPSLASPSKRKFDSGPDTRSKRAAAASSQRTVRFADYPDAFDYSSTSSSAPEPIRRGESGHPLTPGMIRGTRPARRSLGVRS
ncbi:hypothetical protein B0T22DRAFT_427891 [Podospora appendiculata]|uniref:Uncharacterized protein n=1 Tax=Podospora appendiculata TaxID=314037 RepID=A0AAE0XBI6_9PEZI|nr:hypothetical protein B0T22DRAFT_427891 [Podospora appendiculata]